MDPDQEPNPPEDTPPTLEAEPDVETERQARLEYYRSVNKPNKKHRAPKVLGSVVIVLLVAAAGAGGYWHFVVDKPAAKVTKVSIHQATSQKESAANQKIATQPYSSNNFMVTVNYPTTWSVSGDSATDFSITSPVTQLTDASGAAVSGKIIMNMVPQGTLPAAFGTSSVAVLPSVDVDYTEPTPSQRASTYLSFVQYPATTTIGALDGIYVTGDSGYQKDQTIPSTDLSGVNPLITVTFEKCADTACTTGLTPLSIAASNWNNTSFSAPIKTLLTSLAFN